MACSFFFNGIFWCLQVGMFHEVLDPIPGPCVVIVDVEVVIVDVRTVDSLDLLGVNEVWVLTALENQQQKPENHLF